MNKIDLFGKVCLSRCGRGGTFFYRAEADVLRYVLSFSYFSEKIRENALYLLDEPENSLSVERQTKFAKFLEDSARFFGCQFIISTHSPFLLSMKHAKLYDMDARPVTVKPWTELRNVMAFYDFFQERAAEFI